MTTHETTQVEAVRSMTNKDIIVAITMMQAQIIELQAKIVEATAPRAKADTKDMTDDDARNVMTGDLKAAKHRDAAEKLGLTYGQVYSCRLGFTFKNIHKEMKDAGKINAWMK